MNRVMKRIKQDRVLYLMLLPAILYFVIFHVKPIIDMKLAFQDFKVFDENTWVGLKHFKNLFSSPAFKNVLFNTIIISVMKIVFFFPIPIILSLLVNEIHSNKYRKYVQSLSYLPHFLSWVVIAGIWINFLSPDGGFNILRSLFHMPSIDFMTSKDHIRWVIVFSEIWRSGGWDSILYIAAIMRISPSLFEAAKLDGANRLQEMWHITLPAMASTIITVFILNLGFFMEAGFEQVLNFMNDSVISKIDILETYVYRIGLVNGEYSYATAASIFKGLIGLVLIMGTHFASKRITGDGLW